MKSGRSPSTCSRKGVSLATVITTPRIGGFQGTPSTGYLRSLRIFFFWLISEGIIEANPFDRVKIQRSPGKVIPTFSNSQIQQLLNAIDNRIAEMI